MIARPISDDLMVVNYLQMNYKIIFVSDANAALSDAAHNATLENMAFLFGDVMATAELLQCIANSTTS